MKALLVMILLVGGLGGGAYVLSQQEPSVASGLKRVEASAAAAQSFDEKVRAVEAAVDEAKRTGRAISVEVSFTEQELTSKAAEAVSGIGATTGGLVAADPQIHLQGGNVVATSTVTVQGFQLKVGVVATPVVEDGKTKIVIKEIQTGALPIPDAIKQELNARIGATLDPSTIGLPIEVSKLTVVDGKLVISGTAK